MPPKVVTVRYIELWAEWQVWADPVVCYQSWDQKEVLEWLLHWGYEEYWPGCYEREVQDVAA